MPNYSIEVTGLSNKSEIEKVKDRLFIYASRISVLTHPYGNSSGGVTTKVSTNSSAEILKKQLEKGIQSVAPNADVTVFEE
ncbi:MAG: hypothetical protein LBH34_06100 [Prevotellaceae bacterium]|jgi:hypothetical protein|nr:hypothetical protein [Prevotellaceae bacterium]